MCHILRNIAYIAKIDFLSGKCVSFHPTDWDFLLGFLLLPGCLLLDIVYASDGHLFLFFLAAEKESRPIPLPAIASIEWLSGLELIQAC